MAGKRKEGAALPPRQKKGSLSQRFVKDMRRNWILYLLLLPGGGVVEARGECCGTLAYAPRGEGGFGYDPIFFVPALKKTFSELTAQEKNAISHRGKALDSFEKKLKEYLKKAEG